MFNMISYLGNIKLSSIRMAVINKTNHSACWWGYELRKAYSFLELCINTATWKQCRDSYLKESRQIYNRVICTCVYLCVVHNIQGKKPVYLSTITWLEKENTVYIENRILPSPKKQCYAICRKMNQIIYHHVKLKQEKLRETNTRCFLLHVGVRLRNKGCKVEENFLQRWQRPTWRAYSIRTRRGDITLRMSTLKTFENTFKNAVHYFVLYIKWTKLLSVLPWMYILWCQGWCLSQEPLTT